jgi:hypothetical protein
MTAYTDLEFKGNLVTEYLIDIFGMDDDELDPTKLLFCHAEFESGKVLTDKQLVTLSKKYPEVIYLLIKDDLPEDSPIHANYLEV